MVLVGSIVLAAALTALRTCAGVIPVRSTGSLIYLTGAGLIAAPLAGLARRWSPICGVEKLAFCAATISPRPASLNVGRLRASPTLLNALPSASIAFGLGPVEEVATDSFFVSLIAFLHCALDHFGRRGRGVSEQAGGVLAGRHGHVVAQHIVDGVAANGSAQVVIVEGGHERIHHGVALGHQVGLRQPFADFAALFTQLVDHASCLHQLLGDIVAGVDHATASQITHLQPLAGAVQQCAADTADVVVLAVDQRVKQVAVLVGCRQQCALDAASAVGRQQAVGIHQAVALRLRQLADEGAHEIAVGGIRHLATAPDLHDAGHHGAHVDLRHLHRTECHGGRLVGLLHEGLALLVRQRRHALAHQHRHSHAGCVVALRGQEVAVGLGALGEHLEGAADGHNPAVAGLHDHVGADDRRTTVGLCRLPQALGIELAGDGVDLLVARCAAAVAGLQLAAGGLQLAGVHHAQAGVDLPAGDGGHALGVGLTLIGEGDIWGRRLNLRQCRLGLGLGRCSSLARLCCCAGGAGLNRRLSCRVRRLDRGCCGCCGCRGTGRLRGDEVVE